MEAYKKEMAKLRDEYAAAKTDEERRRIAAKMADAKDRGKKITRTYRRYRRSGSSSSRRRAGRARPVSRPRRRGILQGLYGN